MPCLAFDTSAPADPLHQRRERLLSRTNHISMMDGHNGKLAVDVLEVSLFKFAPQLLSKRKGSATHDALRKQRITTTQSHVVGQPKIKHHVGVANRRVEVPNEHDVNNRIACRSHLMDKL